MVPARPHLINSSLLHRFGSPRQHGTACFRCLLGTPSNLNVTTWSFQPVQKNTRQNKNVGTTSTCLKPSWSIIYLNTTITQIIGDNTMSQCLFYSLLFFCAPRLLATTGHVHLSADPAPRWGTSAWDARNWHFRSSSFNCRKESHKIWEASSNIK